MPRTPARSFLVVLLALCVVLAGSVLLFVPQGSSAAIDSVRSTLGFQGPPEPELDRDSDQPELPAVADVPDVQEPAASPTAAPVAASTDPCAPAAAAQSSANQGRAVYVIAETIQFRSGPGLDCPVVSALPFGQQLALAGKPVTRDGIIWRSVEIDGQIGYVASSAVRTKDAEATRTTEIPILMYHLISDEGGGRYVTTPQQLHEQMGWLRDNGYTSLTPSNLYEAIYHDLPLPDKPVMITVDDGYHSDLLFAEIVTSYGFRPVFFWPNYAELTQEEMQYLASQGEACGHTVSHAALSQLSWEGQYAELAPNKAWIEEQLGYPIRCFAYPFGAYNGMTTDVVLHVGYDIAFDAWGEISIVGLVDPIHISRKEIEGTFDLETFATIMTHGYT